MWMPKPSAIRNTPISRRNDRASIFTVGCLLTNVKMKREANSMMPNESTTTTMMTTRFSVIPTAVMTESSEKTMSSRRICVSTEANVTFATLPPAPCSSSAPSSLWWISVTAL